MTTPAADWPLDAALVAGLLADQHPDLAGLPLEPVACGWDNALFRLGDGLAVRLPRREEAVPLILREQRWLPLLAPGLPLPVPVPLRTGGPGRGYPSSWTVQPWLPGRTADRELPPAGAVPGWGRFLRALHRPAPGDAPRNPFRGVPLASRAETVEARMVRLAGRPDWDETAVRRVWDRALAQPQDAAETWIHGDLHPRNLLAEDGQITAVLDWGDLAAGDPATDLASVWMLFPDPGAWAAFEASYGKVSRATRDRALGWAVVLGLLLFETGLADDPAHRAVGLRTLEAVVRFAAEAG